MMMLISSCQHSVETVQISDYCERHISQLISKKQIEETNLIRKNYPETIDFFVSYYVQNETEFKNCKK